MSFYTFNKQSFSIEYYNMVDGKDYFVHLSIALLSWIVKTDVPLLYQYKFVAKKCCPPTIPSEYFHSTSSWRIDSTAPSSMILSFLEIRAL